MILASRSSGSPRQGPSPRVTECSRSATSTTPSPLRSTAAPVLPSSRSSTDPGVGEGDALGEGDGDLVGLAGIVGDGLGEGVAVGAPPVVKLATVGTDPS